MPNPLKVSLENIIPLTEARDHFSQIVNEVQKDKLYVLTKGGKPAVAIVDVKYLEAITGGNVNQSYVKEEIKKAPEKVGLAPMIEHKTNTYDIPSIEPKPAPAPPKPPMTPPTPKPPTPPIPVTPPVKSSFTPSPMTSPSPVAPSTPPAPPKPSYTPPAPPAPPPAKSPTPPSTMPVSSSVSAGSSPDGSQGGPNPAIPAQPASGPTPTAPTPSTPPSNTNAVIETNTNPFFTKQPPVQPAQPTPPAQPVKPAQPTPISVNFSPDYNEKEAQRKPGQTDPEDKPGPAQYSGSSTAAGAANNEPDDMAID